MNDPAPSAAASHVPVLVSEVVEVLAPKAGERMLDCTVGLGGHAGAIMPRLAPGGRYVGIDADPANVERVRRTNPDPPVRLDLAHRNFGEAEAVLEELGVEGVDLLLADLGFASHQMADPGRGLSFTHEGPLDMRLDPTLRTTAADLVNRLPERELADVIYRYGEERFSRRIAAKIVERRRREPMRTTGELASVCAAAYGPRGRRSRIHPATRTFQALRIAVNDELGRLGVLLGALPRLMRRGGRAVVISFHSLEDRMVKRAFREHVAAGRGRALTGKPITADAAERAANPRARSAKMRAVLFE